MSKSNWFNVDESTGVTEINIMGDILMDAQRDPCLEMWDLTDPNTYPKDFKAVLDNATGDINLHINSFGGSVYAGVAISNMIKNYNKGTTTAYVDGIAASVSSLIALSCDKTITPPSAMFMIHRVAGTVSGNVDDLQEAIKVFETVEQGVVNAYMEKAKDGVTEAKIKEYMRATTWFTGEEVAEVFNVELSQDYGLVNYIEPSDPNMKLPEVLKQKLSLEKDLKMKQEQEAKLQEEARKKKEVEVALALAR